MSSTEITFINEDNSIKMCVQTRCMIRTSLVIHKTNSYLFIYLLSTLYIAFFQVMKPGTQGFITINLVPKAVNYHKVYMINSQ